MSQAITTKPSAAAVARALGIAFTAGPPAAGVDPAGGLPARAGVGLKSEHFRDVLESRPDVVSIDHWLARRHAGLR